MVSFINVSVLEEIKPYNHKGLIMYFLPWIPVIVAVLEIVKDKWDD